MDWLRAFFNYFKQIVAGQKLIQEQNQQILDGQKALTLEIRGYVDVFAKELGKIEAQLQEIFAAVVIRDTVSLTAVLVNPDGTQTQGDEQMKFLVSDATKSNILRVTPTDAAGFPSRVDGAISADGADASLITISQNDDLSLRLDYLKTDPGTLIEFTVKADADLGEGVKPVELPIQLEFQAGETVGLGVTLEDAPATV